MKLDYCVLWFEDQFSEIKGDIRRVEQLIKNHGFSPNIEKESSISGSQIDTLANQLLHHNPYDLIIFDYDLGTASITGQLIAKKLRRTIYTDMIFYSGIPPRKLRTMLCDEDVDGVFVVHRLNLFDDIEPIIEDHIKKISDINNMRGIVMDATSLIDNKLRTALETKIGCMNTEQQEHELQTLKGKLSSKNDERQDRLQTLENISEAIWNHDLVNFQYIRTRLKKEYERGSFQYELLDDNSSIHNLQKIRNILAHKIHTLGDEGRIRIETNNGVEEYDFEKFNMLRKQMVETIVDIDQHLLN